jgi:hypothetical protein
LIVAGLSASKQGRGILGEDMARRTQRRADKRARSNEGDRGSSKVERALSHGSVVVAVGVGGVLGVPGALYLVALSLIATGGYTVIEEVTTIILFNLIMFLLVEAPLVSYILQPERTELRVKRLAGWLDANKLRVVSWVVGLCGVVLIGKGIAGLS